MNTKGLFKGMATLLIVVFTMQAKAQQASVPVVQEEKKVAAVAKPMPMSSGFRAAILQIDTVADKVKVWVTNSETKWFTVFISSSNGYEWSYNYRIPLLSQVFDLSTLDDGEYLVKVRCGKQSFTKKVTLSTSTYTRRQIAVE